MAKKKEEQKVNAEAVEKETELTAEEKTALEVQQQAAEGKDISKKVKLADPDTQYAEADFTLQGDEEKELPDQPSAALIQRLRSGFIVEVK